tara:strand:+ start:97 stop:603 length:507 start_codon:yes stop_codon:yes gene_type:complete
MLKKILKSIYLFIISIVSISIILAGWTSYSIITQSPKSNQITEEIKDIYTNQTAVLKDIIDLSKILFKDISERNSYNLNNNIKVETNSLSVSKDDEETNESTILKINKDNQLEIIIEPSLSEASQDPLPEASKGPLPETSKYPLPEVSKDRLINEDNEQLMNEMYLDY